jgi:hypothetical protein
MPWKTPEEEATYALDYGVNRSELSLPGQLAYDQIKTGRETNPAYQPTHDFPPKISARTPPETRARILQMFKRINPKYAKPFDKDRLAVLSVMGGNWEDYGQVVLQMAILDTLLSIEELLKGQSEHS